MKRLISVLISALFILTAATAVFAAEDNLLMHWKFDNGTCQGRVRQYRKNYRHYHFR